jgi:pheromone shutdown protein TraB
MPDNARHCVCGEPLGASVDSADVARQDIAEYEARKAEMFKTSALDYVMFALALFGIVCCLFAAFRYQQPFMWFHTVLFSAISFYYFQYARYPDKSMGYGVARARSPNYLRTAKVQGKKSIYSVIDYVMEIFPAWYLSVFMYAFTEGLLNPISTLSLLTAVLLPPILILYPIIAVVRIARKVNDEERATLKPLPKASAVTLQRIIRAAILAAWYGMIISTLLRLEDRFQSGG